MSQDNSASKGRKKSDLTHQKILNAAEQLFAKNSYEGTTLREIAKQVGIKEPSLYAHFPNKNAIYDSVIERALIPFYTEVDSWDAEQLTLHELLTIPRKLLDLHSEHPFSAQLLHKEFSNPIDKINPKFLQWLKQIAERSQSFSAGLPSSDTSTQDPMHNTLTIITLTNIMLGFFSSQGVQSALLGSEYNQRDLYETHNKIVDKIFKSMLL